jgi:hypothetical protein
VNSVEVEDGLAAQTPVEQGIESGRRVAPRGLDRNLTLQPPSDDQAATDGEVVSGRVSAQPVGEAERVDPDAGRPVEPRSPESDRLIVGPSSDIDHRATENKMLDRLPERGAANALNDQMEVTVEMVEHISGPRRRSASPDVSTSRTRAVTRAPLSRASWTAKRPTPPVAPVTNTRLPRRKWP